MPETFSILRDIFAVIGVLWLLLTLFFWASDAAKHRGEEEEGQ